MNKDKIVEQMLKEKGEVNNTIDLNAYAKGLIDMFEYIEKQGQELPIHSVVDTSVCKRCKQPNDNDCSICYDCTEEVQKLP